MTEANPPPDPANVPPADPPADPPAAPPADPPATPAVESPQPAQEGPVMQPNSSALALLSYASMFLGFPVFILPMATRDDEFALYHARHAGAIYVLWLVLFAVIFVFSFVTCGMGAMLVPVIFLAYIPTIHGLILAAQGEMKEPMMLFGLGEKIFGGIKVHPKD